MLCKCLKISGSSQSKQTYERNKIQPNLLSAPHGLACLTRSRSLCVCFKYFFFVSTDAVYVTHVLENNSEPKNIASTVSRLSVCIDKELIGRCRRPRARWLGDINVCFIFFNFFVVVCVASLCQFSSTPSIFIIQNRNFLCRMWAKQQDCAHFCC